MIVNYASYFKVLLRVNKGQGMVEYIFLASMIALVVIVALGILGLRVVNFFTSFSSQIPT